ncbi:MAG TPA: prepilin-type N-terminal cleavage/methylation domain-containing protein [Patescibacteria group bacterium]
MGKKKASGWSNSFWTIFSNWSDNCSSFWKRNLATIHPFHFLNRIAKGFSLIELVVVIGMLAILFTVLIGIMNPLVQINKAKDSQREHDLEQIKTALDSYYADTGCYPQTLPFNFSFSKGLATYTKNVPQDPNCNSNSPSSCYLYQTDTTSSCPQWNVLYAKLTNPVTNANKIFCPLTQMTKCTATNYISLGYNYCTVSGNIDCTYIASNPLPSPVYLTPTPTGPILSPTPSITLTPTPIPTCMPGYTQLIYSCSGGPPARCGIVPAGQGQFCGSPGCTDGACCFNQCL